MKDAISKTIKPAVAVAGAIVLFGLVVWVYLIPVIVFMRPVSNLTFSNGNISSEFIGFKLKNCVPIFGSETGFVKIENRWYGDIDFYFAHGPKQGQSAPVFLENSYGTWVWKNEAIPSDVMMEINHVCGRRTIISRYGPFEVIE